MGIRVLDAGTVGRIAAGEVVERPSSVCKELMENALDAGATSITVEARGGGVEYLRVTDNGCGIAPEEARLAFENHATSKIASADQLTDIRTLGFRGEALPSIAAVARVTCTTRRRGAQSGVKLVVEGGRFVSLNEAGCPEGTSIVVEELFQNVPARRAFLKKPSVETGAVSDVASALALANPGVAVRLIINGKTALHSFGDGNLRHAALAIYGKDVAARLSAIDQMEGAIRIEGLIGVGDCARPTRSGQSFFINGRVVRCALLTQALESACAGRVTVGTHPMCMLSLTLPPHAVDVNVHPNKLEVRFRDEAGVRQAVDAMFRRAFEGERLLDVSALTQAAQPLMPAPVLTVEHPDEVAKETEVEKISNDIDDDKTEVLNGDAETDRNASCVSDFDRPAPAVLRVRPSRELTLNEGMRARPAEPRPAGPPETAPEQIRAMPERPGGEADYRVIGVAMDTYLLVEAGGSLILIDQHAAHERILYEQYARRLEGPGASQPLLTPYLIPASKREIAQIESEKDLLEEAGFDVAPFDERTLAVRAVPFILGKADLGTLFMDMLGRLDQLKYAARERRRAEVIQAACKHAVKGGDRLSGQQIEELLAAMRETQSPATCPHGRPVCRAISRNELERMFKRQQ